MLLLLYSAQAGRFVIWLSSVIEQSGLLRAICRYLGATVGYKYGVRYWMELIALLTTFPPLPLMVNS